MPNTEDDISNRDLVRDFLPDPITPEDLIRYTRIGEMIGRGSSQQLLDIIKAKRQRDNRLKRIEKMAKLLIKYGHVENYLLAKCIRPSVLNSRSVRVRLKKKDYRSKKTEHDDRIQNRFRTLNRIWGQMGFRVKFHSDKSELINLRRPTRDS